MKITHEAPDDTVVPAVQAILARLQADIDAKRLADPKLVIADAPSVTEYLDARYADVDNNYVAQESGVKIARVVEKLQKVSAADLADVVAAVEAKPTIDPKAGGIGAVEVVK